MKKSNKERMFESWLIYILKVLMMIDLLASLIQPSAAEPATVAYVLCNPGSRVNVHVSAGKGSYVIAYAECGDEIHVDGMIKGDWVHIVDGWAEHDGWIHKGYVSDSEVVIEPFDATGYLKSRIRSKIGGKVIGTLKKGEPIKVYAFAVGVDGWAVTSRGYMMVKYLDDGLGGV